VRGMHENPDVTTVYLGQFTRERANAIAGELEAADITWWYKEPGFFSQIWEYGVRLFVDRARLDEVREIVARVEANPPPPPEDPGGRG
jgi:hypothetical protein